MPIATPSDNNKIKNISYFLTLSLSTWAKSGAKETKAKSLNLPKRLTIIITAKSIDHKTSPRVSFSKLPKKASKSSSEGIKSEPKAKEVVKKTPTMASKPKFVFTFKAEIAKPASKEKASMPTNVLSLNVIESAMPKRITCDIASDSKASRRKITKTPITGSDNPKDKLIKIGYELFNKSSQFIFGDRVLNYAHAYKPKHDGQKFLARPRALKLLAVHLDRPSLYLNK